MSGESSIAIVAHEDGSILPVLAQPGARRVAVSAPPDKGKANAAIQSLLAEALGCKAAQVALISGATLRQKRFRIIGVEPGVLRDRLAALIPRAETTGVSRRDAQGSAEPRRAKTGNN